MSDSTPTTKIEATPGGKESPSRTLLYVLIGIGALLLIAVIVLLFALLGRTAETQPSAAPSPSVTVSDSPSPTPADESPSPEPSAPPVAPPPPAAQPVPGFDSFSAPASAGCSAGDGDIPLTFSWSSDDAVRAYIGVQTNNAKAAPWESNLPPVYTYTNIMYPCGRDSEYYTVTLEDGAGNLTHKTVTITK